MKTQIIEAIENNKEAYEQYNKIVKDLDEAKSRVEEIAAPANAKRIGFDKPCTKTGYCMHCASPTRICATTVVTSRQRVQNRIKVILVGE